MLSKYLRKAVEQAEGTYIKLKYTHVGCIFKLHAYAIATPSPLHFATDSSESDESLVHFPMLH